MFIKSSELCSLSSSNQKRFSSFNRNLPNIYISSSKQVEMPHTDGPGSNFLRCLHCDGITHTGTNALNKHLANFFYLIFFILDTVATHLEHQSKKKRERGKERKQGIFEFGKHSTVGCDLHTGSPLQFALRLFSDLVFFFFFGGKKFAYKFLIKN